MTEKARNTRKVVPRYAERSTTLTISDTSLLFAAGSTSVRKSLKPAERDE
jgi:flagellar motor protein MotB